MKKTFTPEFKGKVAIELIREADTLTAICSKHEIHPTQAGLWKQCIIKGAHQLFGSRAVQKERDEQAKLIAELYGQIGQLTHEVTWLKKKL